MFISYSSKNSDAAKAVCHELEEYGIKCWMAPRDIPPGKNYGDLIDNAISSCKLFLLIYSSKSLASHWCNGELNVAFSEGKPIIPYRIESTPLKGAMKVILSQTHWIDSYPDYKGRFEELVQAVGRLIGVTPNKVTTKDEKQQTIEVKADNGKLTVSDWILVCFCSLSVTFGIFIVLILWIINGVRRKSGKQEIVNPKIIRYAFCGIMIFITFVLIIALVC